MSLQHDTFPDYLLKKLCHAKAQSSQSIKFANPTSPQPLSKMERGKRSVIKDLTPAPLQKNGEGLKSTWIYTQIIFKSYFSCIFA
ncbi:MAG: hypothetical protein A3H98_03385 [Bacteroidetes bacterium RIFCSPLOWO2_02_FULL_36_8]|nr:MAG: hypothetical protein A3H98_03385 [Bacteroidetes bacterium RIFCSPLOWO2_02_FULL_36_8]OFY69485.1 MAG: hypothetical protein A3G23_10630 [Bacteroidetes bacterium RIFCSPLOWO2_12_FULL_37_12]